MTLLLKGIAGICFQVIYLREILTLFCGNEFSISIVFSFWLIGGGIGSFLCRKKLHSPKVYLAVTLFENIFVVASLFLIKISRSFLGVLPGQSFSLSNFLILCFSSCFIAGLLEGARFILAGGLYRGQKSGGRIYALEGVGALIGGACFPLLLLLKLSSFELIFIVGLFNILTLFLIPRRKYLAAACIGVWLLLSFLSPFLEKKSLSLQWKPFKPVESFYSIYGNLTVLSRLEEKILVRDGVPEVSNQPDRYSLRNMAYFSLAFCSSIKKVLVVGNAELLPELEKYPVKEIHFLEIDPAAISLVKKYFLGDDQPKIFYHFDDPFAFLKNNKQKFDVVILGHTFPLSLRENRLVTEEFGEMLKKHLCPNGIVMISLPGSPDYLGNELLRLHSSVYHTFKRSFQYSKIICDYPVMYLFSDTCTFTDIAFRSSPYPEFFNPFVVSDILSKYKEKRQREQLSSCVCLPNRNLYPTTIYYAFCFWFSKFSSGIGGFFSKFYFVLLHAGNYKYLFFLIVFAVFLFPSKKEGWGRGLPKLFYNIGFANGLVSLGFEILILFLFQIRFGYLYFFISLLIGCFMAGLSGGGFLAEKFGKPSGIVYSELCQFLFYLAVPVIVVYFREHFFLFGFVLVLAGFLTGFEFGLITFILKKNSIIEETGKVYALDLIGGLCSCLLIPFLILPLFGLVYSFVFLSVIKFANFIAVLKYKS